MCTGIQNTYDTETEFCLQHRSTETEFLCIHKKQTILQLNFLPYAPQYSGIGCTNFKIIYNLKYKQL